jgi:hypothetical protein
VGLYDVGKEVLSAGRVNSQQSRSERTDQWIAALRKRRGTEGYNGRAHKCLYRALLVWRVNYDGLERITIRFIMAEGRF